MKIYNVIRSISFLAVPTFARPSVAKTVLTADQTVTKIKIKFEIAVYLGKDFSYHHAISFPTDVHGLQRRACPPGSQRHHTRSQPHHGRMPADIYLHRRNRQPMRRDHRETAADGSGKSRDGSGKSRDGSRKNHCRLRPATDRQLPHDNYKHK